MARPRSDAPVTQSLLDRLTSSVDLPTSRAASIQMFKNGIKRDVEWLLNTRRTPGPQIDDYELASASVFNYGLPDVNELGGSGDNAARVLAAILQTLRTHEPRILEPRVSLVRSDMLKRSIQFHVDGRVRVENSEEDISFDTLLKVTTGEYEVK
jgi:type VI secretion system protein ImpF